MTEDVKHPSLEIRADGDDRIKIQVFGRSHGHANDYWDGNWLTTLVTINVGGFSAELGGNLRAEELQAFRLEIEAIYAAIAGTANLQTMEQWLSMSIGVNGSGQVQIRGQAREESNGYNRLSFELSGLDQSHLPAMIDALNEIEERFPVVGDP